MKKALILSLVITSCLSGLAQTKKPVTVKTKKTVNNNTETATLVQEIIWPSNTTDGKNKNVVIRPRPAVVTTFKL